MIGKPRQSTTREDNVLNGLGEISYRRVSSIIPGFHPQLCHECATSDIRWWLHILLPRFEGSFPVLAVKCLEFVIRRKRVEIVKGPDINVELIWRSPWIGKRVNSAVLEKVVGCDFFVELIAFQRVLARN